MTGLVHRRDGDAAGEDYQMMSLDFSDGGHPGTGRSPKSVAAATSPPAGRRPITYRPLAALQVSCENGIAFVDLPATLVWFDEAGRHQESLDSERPVGEQLLTQFHRAVTSLVRRTCDLEDAYRALTSSRKPAAVSSKGRRIAL